MDRFPETEDISQSHDAFRGNHPDYSHITSLHADLYGRSDSFCSGAYPHRNSENDPGTSAVRPCALWPL